MANKAIQSITELINAVSRKEIPEDENPNEVIGVVEKIIDLFSNKKAQG